MQDMREIYHPEPAPIPGRGTCPDRGGALRPDDRRKTHVHADDRRQHLQQVDSSGPQRNRGGQIRQKKTINDIIMDSLEERLKIIMDAATNLVEQVENYTTKAGSRFLLLDAKDRLKKVLEKRAP